VTDAEQTQAHVTFRGNVQGVGFRYTTVRVASSFTVTGCVMNMPDGTVEMVVEGERDEITAFLEAVCDRMGRHIRDHDVQWKTPTGEFSEFGVRFAWQ
jgi:acylphosphatase